MLSRDTFPHRDLSDTESILLHQIVLKPSASVERTSHFLRVLGRPLLKGDPELLLFLHAAVTKTADTLDLDYETTNKAFSAGAIIYASTVGHCAQVPRLPLQRQAVETVSRLDQVDLVFDSHACISNQSRNFYAFLTELLPTAASYDSFRGNEKAAVIGAGALHILITESERLEVSPDTLSMAHPELADLEAIFKDVPSQEL